MFKLELVKASDCGDLKSKLSPMTVIVLKPRKSRRILTTRESVLVYLETRLHMVNSQTALAVPVMLPQSPEYQDAISELHRLGELLKEAVRPWARKNLEEKLVEQTKILHYMEEQAETRELHWAVYRTEEKSNGQSIQNRTTFQQSNYKRPESRFHA
jgi:hypothetical protein